MKKILWVSRNHPIDSQVNELKKLFGDDVQIDQDSNPFSSAEDIIRRYDKGNYDEFVVMAPLSVCRIITEAGYRPLYSEMRKSTSEESEVEVQGMVGSIRKPKRYYKFVRFKRLEAIDMIFTDL